MEEKKYRHLKRLISQRIDELGVSHDKASQMCGLSPTVIWKIQRGLIRHPRADTIMKIAEGLEFSEKDYLYLIDPRAKTMQQADGTEPYPLGEGHAVPLISWIQAGNWHQVMDDFPPGVADDYVYTDIKGRNLFALKVLGDSMEPRFHEGDVIIINPNIHPRSGDFAVVKLLDTEEVIFKKYIEREKEGLIILKPLNPEYHEIHLGPDDNFLVIGKAVEKKEFL